MYVFVYGGGYGGWCWDCFVFLLRVVGYIVFVLMLCGVVEWLGEGMLEFGFVDYIVEVV